MGICIYSTIQAVPKKMASESVVQIPRDRCMVSKKKSFKCAIFTVSNKSLFYPEINTGLNL